MAVQTPSEGGLVYTRVDLPFSDIESNGAHIAWVDAAVVPGIPVGSQLYFETTSDSYTLMDAVTYTPFASGSIINGKAEVEWTEEIAAAAANGFMIYTATSCTALYYVKISGSETEYKQVDISYAPFDNGDTKLAWVDAGDAVAIPVGVTVYFSTASESFTFMDNATYTPFASGSTSDGVGTLIWTEEIAAAAANGFMISLTAECTALYYKEEVTDEPAYTKVDLSFSPMDSGENKIAWIDEAVASAIPTGVTLYFESASASFTLMDNAAYTPFASGNLADGVGTVEWTAVIAAAAANGFMIYLEAECTALYYLQEK